jgi:hypothetical protein
VPLGRTNDFVECRIDRATPKSDQYALRAVEHPGVGLRAVLYR